MAGKNNWIWWLLGIGTGLYLLSEVNAGGTINDISIFNGLLNLFTSDKILKLYQAYSALKNLGYTGVKLKLALSQVMYETGVFSSASSVASSDNNLTGIMWINNPAVQKNATQGTPMPGTPYYYADFDTLQDWAIDYDRIVNMGPYMPIDNATTPQDFASLLKENGYYTGDEATYSNGLTDYWNDLTSIGF